MLRQFAVPHVAERFAHFRFDVGLERIEVGTSTSRSRRQRERGPMDLKFDLIGNLRAPEGGAFVAGHLLNENTRGFCQVLALAYLHPRVIEGQAEPALYSAEELETWSREVGAEVIWDLARRAAVSLAVQMEFDLEFDIVPPVFKWSIRQPQGNDDER